MQHRLFVWPSLGAIVVMILACGQQHAATDLSAIAPVGSGANKLFASAIHEAANLAIPIPDTSEASYPFMVEDSGFLDQVSVQIMLDHTYIGDLVVSLTTPGGKKAVLHDRTGGSTDNLSQIYGVGGEANASLAGLVGEDINGQWLLLIQDQAGADEGVLKYFKLSGTRVFR